jgi:hypothetical protein
MLVELDEVLRAKGVELLFAELKDPVKDKLRRFGLLTHFGEAIFFATIEAAVVGYLRQEAVNNSVQNTPVLEAGR